LIVALTVVLAGCTETVKYVLIDRSDPSYTCFASIPEPSAEKMAQIKAEIAKDKVSEIMTVEEFEKNADTIVKSAVVRDDYPGSGTVSGIVEFTRKYVGTPIGLTFNGGIAFTRMDYTYTKKIFAAFKEGPDSYAAQRKTDPKFDPINPAGHFGPLLGR